MNSNSSDQADITNSNPVSQDKVKANKGRKRVGVSPMKTPTTKCSSQQEVTDTKSEKKRLKKMQDKIEKKNLEASSKNDSDTQKDDPESSTQNTNSKKSQSQPKELYS